MDDATLHLLDPASIPSAGIGGPAANASANVGHHDLVQPIRQLLSNVASNHPGRIRPLEEELSQLETSDENFHRCASLFIIESIEDRSALFLNNKLNRGV